MDTTFIRYNETRPENIVAWKILLKELSVEQIHKQFEEYKWFCHNHSTSFNLIEEKVNSLFLIDYKNQKFPLHFKFSIETEKHHPDYPLYFFRIRQIKKGVRWGDEERGLNHMNFAFFENHIKNNLELVGIRVCSLVEQKGMLANIKIIADGFWNEELNKMEYYSPYSDKSKKIFTQYLNIMMSK